MSDIISAQSASSFRYIGGGTIHMGSIGDRVPHVLFIFYKYISWRVNSEINITVNGFSFSWDVGDVPNHWYRVIGECQKLSDPNSPVQSNQKCNAHSFQIFMAKSVHELCEKIARSNFITRIISIDRYSTPVDNDVALQYHAAGIIDIKKNELVPISYSQYKSCLPLSVHTKTLIEIGCNMTVRSTYIRCVGSGGIYFKGSAIVNRAANANGFGGITLSGSAGVTSNYSQYIGTGKIVLSGSAGITKSNWKYVGVGGINISGQVKTISPSHRFVGNGGISISGQNSSKVKISYRSPGFGPSPSYVAIKISGSAIEKVKHYYKTTGQGSISISGRAGNTSNRFRYIGSNGVTVGGHASSVSPSFHAIGSGGVSIGGIAVVLPKIYVAGNGGILLSGVAPLHYKTSYTGSGTINFSGTGRIVNKFFGSGKITLSGTAAIQSTWKGSYLDQWGMNAFCENLEPVFGEDNAVPLVVVNPSVIRCGVTFAQKLQVSHNLGDADVLKNFITRNGYNLTSIFDLYYHRLSDSWRSNYHFAGSGDRAGREIWDILVEWGCVSDDVASGWKFSFYVSRRNEQSRLDFDTRIIIILDPEPLTTRFNNDGIDLNIKFNPFTKRPTVASSNATIQSSVFFDNIGLFRSSIWKTQPFQFRLNSIGSFHKIPRYNILPIFPKAGEFDLT